MILPFNRLQCSSTKEANENITQSELKTFEQLNSKSETFSLKYAQPNVVLSLRLTYSCILLPLGVESAPKNQSPMDFESNEKNRANSNLHFEMMHTIICQSCVDVFPVETRSWDT